MGVSLIREINFTRYLQIFRIVLSLILCTAVAFYVVASIHWRLAGDASIMHYVNFLMARGLAPYRQIIDINLPGSYFMEGLAMHIFGGGDIAWRIYDFTLLLILTASLIVIAWPYDWFAGLFAGAFFILIHGSEGPMNSGQREELMITMIMAGYALLFSSMRYRKPILLLPFGFLLGIAASLKPTSAPLSLLLLLMAAMAFRKRNIKFTSYVLYGILGMLLATILNVAFFYHYHSFHAFVAISERLVPYYASIGNAPRMFLLFWLFHHKYSVVLAIAAGLLFVNRAANSWENWERISLVLGIAFGVSSFVAQRKLFNHHAYSFIVFALIWSAIEVCKALKRVGWPHVVGLACILLLFIDTAPGLLVNIAQQAPYNAEPDALREDLTRLGGSGLQHQVQCFDMVSACFLTLYHMQLMPYSNFMGDYMFLGPKGSPPIPYFRNQLWDQLHANPPRVIVLTNMWLGSEVPSFGKIDQWPELAAFLQSEYTQEPTRTFNDRFAYKIYVLKTRPNVSALSTKAVALSHGPTQDPRR